jgi:hypothetical protein
MERRGPLVTPLGHLLREFGRDIYVVSYEQWPDRSVVRIAAPGDALELHQGRVTLRREDREVAVFLAAGGGVRGGLNTYEFHVRPAVPYSPGLVLSYLPPSRPEIALPLGAD